MIFLDTGAFLARYIEADQHHKSAVAGWKRLLTERRRCFTSNFVLDETLTLLARRTSYRFAAEKARAAWDSTALEILRPTESTELDAIVYFEKFADQKVSFTDCVSFALMKERRIKSVFGFDRHFERAGFQIWP